MRSVDAAIETAVTSSASPPKVRWDSHHVVFLGDVSTHVLRRWFQHGRFVVEPSPATHVILIRLKAGDEGGRVHQALLVAMQCVKAIYSRTTTVSGTFWRPGGI